MPSGRKYLEELKQRAIRLVAGAREQDEGLSPHAAVVRIVELVGVHVDTFRVWGVSDRYQCWAKTGRDHGVRSADQRVGTCGPRVETCE